MEISPGTAKQVPTIRRSTGIPCYLISSLSCVSLGRPSYIARSEAWFPTSRVFSDSISPCPQCKLGFVTGMLLGIRNEAITAIKRARTCMSPLHVIWSVYCFLIPSSLPSSQNKGQPLWHHNAHSRRIHPPSQAAHIKKPSKLC